MSRFLLPMVIALVVAIVSIFTNPVRQLSRWTPLFATGAIAALEILIYCVFIVR